MIKNKVLFFATFIIGNIGFAFVLVQFMGKENNSASEIGILFIISSIICSITHTLLKISLNKIPIIDKIYKFLITMSILILVAGILILVFC